MFITSLAVEKAGRTVRSIMPLKWPVTARVLSKI